MPRLLIMLATDKSLLVTVRVFFEAAIIKSLLITYIGPPKAADTYNV